MVKVKVLRDKKIEQEAKEIKEELPVLNYEEADADVSSGRAGYIPDEGQNMCPPDSLIVG